MTVLPQQLMTALPQKRYAYISCNSIKRIDFIKRKLGIKRRHNVPPLKLRNLQLISRAKEAV